MTIVPKTVLIAIALAVVCGSIYVAFDASALSKRTPIEYHGGIATDDCAPWDGPATAFQISQQPGPVKSLKNVPHYYVSVYSATLAKHQWIELGNVEKGGASLCKKAYNGCNPLEHAAIQITRETDTFFFGKLRFQQPSHESPITIPFKVTKKEIFAACG